MAKKFEYSLVFKVGNVFTKSLLALGVSFNGSTSSPFRDARRESHIQRRSR